MSDRAAPTQVDRAIPVNRDAQNALRLLALRGMWIGPAWHAEDLVSFLSVIRHWTTSLRPRSDLEVGEAPSPFPANEFILPVLVDRRQFRTSEMASCSPG